MPHHPKVPKAPEPSRIFFDPFNSSSTGHQRAENRLSGSTAWRESRSHKLSHQYSDTSGHGGKAHISDTVGAGSVNWGKDGRKENGSWEPDAPGLREKGWQDIRSLLGNSRKRRSESLDIQEDLKKRKFFDAPSIARSESLHERLEPQSDYVMPASAGKSSSLPQIFRGLTMFVNGSTMPLVSDWRLKQLFAQHGGNTSISLGRRTVTLVILGQDKLGGGLASTKIQKENATVRGKGIKYVSAEWVLDSVGKGIRQPETRYTETAARTKLGGCGQKSAATAFEKQTQMG